MAGRSAKYNNMGGRRDEQSPFIYTNMPPPPHAGGPLPPFTPGYDAPQGHYGGPHDLGQGLPQPPSLPPPIPRRPGASNSPPPMPSILNAGSSSGGGGGGGAPSAMGEGGPGLPSPWEVLNKHQSHKVTTIPAYSSLNKKEAPMYEELINFPRAKDKDDMRCVISMPPSATSAVSEAVSPTWPRREKTGMKARITWATPPTIVTITPPTRMADLRTAASVAMGPLLPPTHTTRTTFPPISLTARTVLTHTDPSLPISSLPTTTPMAP
ncbi:hypothetical protein VYU27_007437, partial [Nannochloropsis oceanica]